MCANQDQVTRQIRNRLQTTCMGLGLVRLLQDAKRFEEASATLYSLEFGFQGVAIEMQEELASCRDQTVFRTQHPTLASSMT